MTKLRIGAAALAAVLVASPAFAAGLFNGYPEGNGAAYCASYNQPGGPGTASVCTNNVPAGPALTGNELVPADSGVTPGQVGGSGSPGTTIVIPSTAVGSLTAPRNLLGNGDMLGTQVNGTATVTFATTSAATYAALVADRWVGDVNVGSGAGRSAVITASPAPPTGFTQSVKMYRTSGSLGQPVCSWSVVPSAQSTQIAGQTVTFSGYVAALAGLAADNGSAANLVIISGTGTDQGLAGSWTASPAITPAWTGITTVVNTPITLTTSFARFSTSATIPTTATEVGVAICFTPSTASSGGSTDGIAFTGMQLERSNVASLFEVRSRTAEILDNEQFVYAIHDTAGPSPVLGLCTETTANTDAACWLQYPVPMYVAPTVSLVNCGSACFAMPTTTAQTAVTSTCALTVNATFTYIQGVQGTYLQCAQSGTTAAVGITLPILMSTSATNSGVIVAWTGL